MQFRRPKRSTSRFSCHEITASRRINEHVNLVIVTLDTTRADHLGPYGYRQVATPWLDRIAADGIVFDQAESVAPLTLPAHCSLFTGVLPPMHGVHDNRQQLGEQATLATILRARGARTGAFLGSKILARGRGLAQGFDMYDDEMTPKAGDTLSAYRRSASDVMDHALGWLNDASSSQFFAWLHLYDAHAPYRPPVPFAQTYAGRSYDGAIAFMDAQIGRLVTFLEQHRLLDRTVIVVVGDHGEALGEHGEWTHARLAYEAVLRIPIIVRLPFRAFAGRRVVAVTSGVDVYPTVLHLLDIESRASLAGKDLLPIIAAGSRADETAYSENEYPARWLGGRALHVLRVGRFKLIDDDAVTELYDLEADPRETHNLASVDSRLTESLRRRLIALRDPGNSSNGTTNREADSPGALAALGYLSR